MLALFVNRKGGTLFLKKGLLVKIRVEAQGTGGQ